MAEYVLSKKALSDLRSIWNYTVETWSEEQADAYYRDLIQAFEAIANRPESAGHSYEEVRSGYRGRHSGRHIIFYRVLKSGKVRIVRILHERMDFGRHL